MPVSETSTEPELAALASGLSLLSPGSDNAAG